MNKNYQKQFFYLIIFLILSSKMVFTKRMNWKNTSYLTVKFRVASRRAIALERRWRNLASYWEQKYWTEISNFWYNLIWSLNFYNIFLLFWRYRKYCKILPSTICKSSSGNTLRSHASNRCTHNLREKRGFVKCFSFSKLFLI